MITFIAALLVPVAAPCDGSTTPEVERCLDANLGRAEVELNRYYNTAVEQLSKQQQNAAIAQLGASQRAWQTYRDAECNAIFERWKDASVRGAMAVGCQIRVTKARTMIIWRNWLTTADKSPPLLTRPEDGS
ncbi:lysozyme inhibitor LprI family protein [Sphingomonas ginsenosidivorax]|uniref:lysozyme inhibitor LprI family protein n=1 Tax=Sphingomonas ginsenosidivorax TaxID=862135 RepID=UPI00131516BC|nr:lysozyme inhibitor LprI family protein [Sphingomonas ginsenosidivorax]